MFRALARDDSPRVREAVARNPNCPGEVLADLASGEDRAHIRMLAEANLSEQGLSPVRHLDAPNGSSPEPRQEGGGAGALLGCLTVIAVLVGLAVAVVSCARYLAQRYSSKLKRAPLRPRCTDFR